jgi:hypothetical protein
MQEMHSWLGFFGRSHSVNGPIHVQASYVRWKQTTSPAARRSSLGGVVLLFAAMCGLAASQSGCGATVQGPGSSTNSGTLVFSAASLDFGSVALGQAGAATVSVSNSGSSSIEITQIELTGSPFSLRGQNPLPIEVAAGASHSLTVVFQPITPGAAAGALSLVSNSSSDATAAIPLSGTGAMAAAAPGTLSAVPCSSGTMTGVGTDACTVELTAPAGAGGLAVSLKSSSAAVVVPESVTVAAGARSAGFTAKVNAVSTAETVKLTAQAGSVSESYALKLGAAVPELKLSKDSVAFGDVKVKTAATETVTLTSSGTAALIIRAGAVTGAGFSATGMSYPVTLEPGKTASLTVKFDPTANGSASGTVKLTTNTSAGTEGIALSGTGEAAAKLSYVTCDNETMTGAKTDECTVKLTSPAGTGGLAVSLKSSIAAVVVPESVTVAAGATSADFTAKASAVTKAETATLTARAGSATESYALKLGASVPELKLSKSSVAFGDVKIKTAATETVTLTSSGTAALIIRAGAVTGAGFSATGMSYPVTLEPGKTASLTVKFDPAASGAVAGAVKLTTNASGGTEEVALSGTGKAAALSAMTCSREAITGADADACTVKLTGPAATGGQAVSLKSSSAAVVVPESVTVEAGATSAEFTAKVSAVTTAETTTLTARAGSVSESYALKLGAAVPELKLSKSSVAFGDVTVRTAATETVTLTSSGTAALIIHAGAVAGAGFSATGMSYPVTLEPGKTASLTVRFDPTATEAVAGAVRLTTNTSGRTEEIALSGTGKAAALSAVTCSKVAITGAAADECTVKLTGPAETGGLAVSLKSSSAAVVVPESVKVAAGTTSAEFTAKASAVTEAETATLTAQAGRVSESYALRLGAAVPELKLATTSVSFGDVAVKTAATKTVTITSSGTAPVTISAGSVTGTGFSTKGMSFPVTLQPGQTANLTVQFEPPTKGATTGAVALTTNATSERAAISLSGTGEVVSGLLSVVACNSGTMTGAGTDECFVELASPAGSGGQAVSLWSSSAAVAVPESVIVPEGGTTAGFAATVSAVTAAQTATLTAQAGRVSVSFALQLGATNPGLTLSAASVAFGNVALNTAATKTVTLTSSGAAAVTINAAAVTGAGFSASGMNYPVTLQPGQTAALTVQFDPTMSGAASGTVVLTTNTSSGTAAIALSGTGQAAAGVLNALTCSSGTMTGAGTDACTVALTAPAGTGGLTVSLSSSSGAVAVPSSVTVPAGATTAGFTATVSAVTAQTAGQTATLTAQAGSVSESFALKLGATTPGLTLSVGTVAFGNVTLNTTATQTVTLTSSGTAPLTINAGVVTGAGFSVTGMSYPLTLQPGQTATLTVQFDPTVSGAAIGAVALTTNTNTSAGAAVIALSGTGATAAYQVDVSWNAPIDSTDPVAGYDVYRAVSGSSSYELLNSSLDDATSYTDTTVQEGVAYTYYIVSVDASGDQSDPSNLFSVTVP